MVSIIKVTGESLSPFLQHGDYVLVGRSPFWLRRIQPGDVVVFYCPPYGRLIKRIQSISADGQEIFVVGDAPASVDSRQFGPIPRSAVIGKTLHFFRRSTRQA